MRRRALNPSAERLRGVARTVFHACSSQFPRMRPYAPVCTVDKQVTLATHYVQPVTFLEIPSISGGKYYDVSRITFESNQTMLERVDIWNR